MVGYLNIALYYQLNFSLMQHHKYSLSDLNSLYPYERDIYVALLADFLQRQEQEQREQQQKWQQR